MEENQEQDKPQNILDIIKDFPNAPNQVIIDEWKSKYGDIFFSGFSEKECFIFRALNRAEYRQMQIQSQLQANKPEPKNPDELEIRIKENMNASFAQEEDIVAKCLLWPKLTTEELTSKAGTVPTLLEQIMQNSNFVTPVQAAQLVIKL